MTRPYDSPWQWLATLALLSASGSALAAPGEHVQVGSAEIIPAVEIGFETRTNAYRVVGEAQTGDAEDAVEPSVNLLVSPSLAIDVDTPEVWAGFSGQYDLRKYLTTGHGNLDKFRDFNVELEGDFLRKQVVGLNLYDNVAIRSFETDAQQLDSSILSLFRNVLGGGASVRAGPAIVVHGGASWHYNDYMIPGQADEDRQSRLNTRHQYGPEWELSWAFFPNTRFVVEGEYHLYRWNDNAPSAEGNHNGPGLGTVLAMPDSNHFRTSMGLRGRITTRLVLSATIGYGSAKYLEDSVPSNADAEPAEFNAEAIGYDADVTGLDSLIAAISGSYDFGAGQRLNLGYYRDFTDAYFTNYIAYNSVSARLDSEFGRHVSSNLFVVARFEEYVGEVSRGDVLLRAGGDVSFHFGQWATLTAGAHWIERASEHVDVQYDDVNIHLVGMFTY